MSRTPKARQAAPVDLSSMPARDVRIGVLYGMSSRALLALWRREVGPGVLVGRATTRWTKDELVDDIIRHEFGPIKL